MRQQNNAPPLDWDMSHPIPPIEPQVVKREWLEDPSEVAFREPVVGRLTFADMSRSGKQWDVLAQQVRGAVAEDAALRDVLVEAAAKPVTETLPHDTMGRLAEKNAAVARTLHVASHVSSLLGLPAVPEAARSRGITHATVAPVTNKIVYHSADADPTEYRAALANSEVLSEDGEGMTTDEKRLALQRLEFARDVKVLGLMAELHDHPFEGVAKDGVVNYRLPSGTELALSDEAFAAEPNLLDPSKWERREQIKDRVYRVWVDGKDYIMKERKTEGHADVAPEHRPGLTSQEEFEVAREFAELDTVTKGDVSLRWEKPLGYATFPDGYQFCMFESDDAINTGSPSTKSAEMQAAILANPEAYAEELAKLNSEAVALLEARPDLMVTSRAGAGEGLTLQEFASLKGAYAAYEAKQLLEETMAAKGYDNGDEDGLVFKVVQHDGRAKMEVVAFDFEYYAKEPGFHAEKQQDDANGTTARTYAFHGDRPTVTAASYVMMRRMGWALPPA